MMHYYHLQLSDVLVLFDQPDFAYGYQLVSLFTDTLIKKRSAQIFGASLVENRGYNLKRTCVLYTKDFI